MLETSRSRRRLLARAALATGWLALFATSEGEPPRWLIAAAPYTERVFIPGGASRAIAIDVTVDGHEEVRTASLRLRIEGAGDADPYAFPPYADAGMLAPFEVLGPSERDFDVGWYEDDGRGYLYTYGGVCAESVPCVRTFVVRTFGYGEGRSTALTYTAFVQGYDTTEPPPGVVSIAVRAVSP